MQPIAGPAVLHDQHTDDDGGALAHNGGDEHEHPPADSVHYCSVRGCTAVLPMDYTHKMCESCRGRHRIYASTKRAKRKQEKAMLGVQAGAVWLQNDLEAAQAAVEAAAAASPIPEVRDALITCRADSDSWCSPRRRESNHSRWQRSTVESPNRYGRTAHSILSFSRRAAAQNSPVRSPCLRRTPCTRTRDRGHCPVHLRRAQRPNKRCRIRRRAARLASLTLHRPTRSPTRNLNGRASHPCNNHRVHCSIQRASSP